MEESTKASKRGSACASVVLSVFPEIMQKLMKYSGTSAEWLHRRIEKDKHFQKKLTKEEHQVIKTLLTDEFTKLDLTLIFKIITHYANVFVDSPTRGWSSYPLSNEITIGDDAQRLRLKRNEILHKSVLEADETEYENFFSEVISVCARVDKHMSCTEEESFTRKIETIKSQSFQNVDEIKQNLEKEKYANLEEFFVEKIGRHTFSVCRATSLKTLMQTIEEPRDEFTAITLEFPEIRNSELIEIMKQLKDVINKGLVNIRVKSIVHGSLIMRIDIRSDILSNDEKLKTELVLLMKHLSTISSFERCFSDLHNVNIVVYDSSEHIDNDRSKQSWNEETNHVPGALQFHLEVRNDVLQSDQRLKAELGSFFETIVSKTNGNALIPNDIPVVSVIAPSLGANQGFQRHAEMIDNQSSYAEDDKLSSIATCLEAVHLNKLHLQRHFELDHENLTCCCLPNGDFVFADIYDQCLRITNSDGALKSTVQIPDLHKKSERDRFCLAVIDDSCIALSIDFKKTILTIDVNKKTVLNKITLMNEPSSMTFFMHKVMLYCVHGQGIRAINMTDNQKDETAVHDDKSVRWNSQIASSEDKICYCTKYHGSVTVLDSTYNVLFQCKNSEIMIRPFDLAIDQCGFIYVLSEKLHNLVLISPDDRNTREILNRDNGLTKPSHVCYDSRTHQLLIIDGSTVKVFSSNTS